GCPSPPGSRGCCCNRPVICPDIFPERDQYRVPPHRVGPGLRRREPGYIRPVWRVGRYWRGAAFDPPAVPPDAGDPSGRRPCRVLEGTPVIFPEHCKVVGVASSKPCGNRVYTLSRYLLRETDRGTNSSKLPLIRQKITS